MNNNLFSYLLASVIKYPQNWYYNDYSECYQNNGIETCVRVYNIIGFYSGNVNGIKLTMTQAAIITRALRKALNINKINIMSEAELKLQSNLEIEKST